MLRIYKENKRMKNSRPLALLEVTSRILSGYLSQTKVSRQELYQLIDEVYEKVEQLEKKEQRRFVKEPAVSVEDSIQPEYLVCLEDGRKLKMLKRHLKTVYSMTPQEYREKWGLPADYPMVAPNYAATRSKLAKKIGLGTAKKPESPKVPTTEAAE